MFTQKEINTATEVAENNGLRYRDIEPYLKQRKENNKAFTVYGSACHIAACINTNRMDEVYD